jgi:hypothetical protein
MLDTIYSLLGTDLPPEAELMPKEVEIDRDQLRNVVERVLFETDRDRETAERAATVGGLRPETIVELMEVGTLLGAIRRLDRRVPEAADCSGCVAFSGASPPFAPIPFDGEVLSEEVIDRLADEMLETIEIR